MHLEEISLVDGKSKHLETVPSGKREGLAKTLQFQKNLGESQSHIDRETLAQLASQKLQTDGAELCNVGGIFSSGFSETS